MIESTVNLLLIDDDQVDRMAVKRALKSSYLKTNVTEAHDVAGGIELLSDNSFDCIFVDYQLPDGDGLDVVKNIRDRDIDTPIIFLTGRGDEELVVRALEAGASQYIPKAKLSGAVIEKSLFSVIRIHKAEAERKEAEIKLKIKNRQIASILESITDSFFAVDANWQISYVNTQAGYIFKEETSQLLGTELWDVLYDPDDWFATNLKRAKDSHLAINVEGFYSRLTKWINLHVYPSQDGLSVYFNDITDKKEAEARLNYIASHDLLTDLPNRMMLLDRITQALSRVAWHNRFVAVLFLDLDRFKHVNDTFGHSAGDEVLVTIANRVRAELRQGDTIARIGGDEFVIILSDLARKEDALNVSHKLLEIIAKPMLGDRRIQMKASIGICFYPGDGGDAEALLRNADAAMYQAKQYKNGNIQVFTPDMSLDGSTTIHIEHCLMQKELYNELKLLYQPIVNIQKSTTHAYESLIRWNSKTLGNLLPGAFLSVAEDIGMMENLGSWVLDRAIRQAKLLNKEIVSVNVSYSEFLSKNYFNKVTELLELHGLKPEQIELELTENIVVEDYQETIAVLKRFRDLGMNIALDDFGTGYSSLAYLKKLPITTIKMDRSFITDLLVSNQDLSIVRSIIELSHCLDLKVVAEGVENEAQYQRLVDMGCDLAQGFLISPPLEEEATRQYRFTSK